MVTIQVAIKTVCFCHHFCKNQAKIYRCFDRYRPPKTIYIFHYPILCIKISIPSQNTFKYNHFLVSRFRDSFAWSTAVLHSASSRRLLSHLHHRNNYGLSKSDPPSFDPAWMTQSGRVPSLNELSFITLINNQSSFCHGSACLYWSFAFHHEILMYRMG